VSVLKKRTKKKVHGSKHKTKIRIEKTHNRELHPVYLSRNIVRMITQRRTGVNDLAHKGQNETRILLLEGKLLRKENT
jgi:hypothetical protein